MIISEVIIIVIKCLKTIWPLIADPTQHNHRSVTEIRIVGSHLDNSEKSLVRKNVFLFLLSQFIKSVLFGGRENK